MNAPAQQTTLAQMRQPQPEQLPAVRAGFFDLNSFELIQRVSKAFASSDLVPKQYQGNLANCMIAMDMAQRMGANPLMCMQNLYVVHGTPSWSSKFLIATINASGRYSSLRYEWRGKPGEADYGCRAWAIERETGERLEGIWVDWKMVKAEGWDAKNGSKWKTMPDQMFVYRAAAFWQRAYAPELGMGLQTVEDVNDTFDAGRGNDGMYSVDLDGLRSVELVASTAVVDKETGEIHDSDDAALKQVEQKQTTRVPPVQTKQAEPVPAGEWQPSPEELAAIHAQEMAEASAPPRQRRERGSMNVD